MIPLRAGSLEDAVLRHVNNAIIIVNTPSMRIPPDAVIIIIVSKQNHYEHQDCLIIDSDSRMWKGVHMRKIIAWLCDPFFFELIEAQHSPDSQAMNRLYEKYF